MAVREIFNPISSFGQMAYGIVGMGSSYIPLAQSAANEGMVRYGMGLWGGATLTIGLAIAATAVHTTFNYLRNKHASVSVQSDALPVAATSQDIQAIITLQESYKNRMMDATGGFLLAAFGTQLDPASSKVLGTLGVAFGLGKAAYAGVDYIKLWRLRTQAHKNS